MSNLHYPIIAISTKNVLLSTYLGIPFKYIVLAGTIFIAVFTTAGIFMGMLADWIHRPRLLSACVLLFSVSGALTGVATEYWHLVVLRLGIAIG